MRLLADRRDELSRRRVQTVNRLQPLLTELVPGGAKRDLSAQQAKRLLATVRPRSLVGTTIRGMAVEEIADLVAVDTKLKAMKTPAAGRGQRPRLTTDGPVRCRTGHGRADPVRRR